MGGGILEVQLLDARGLKDTDFFGKMDPYVVIKYHDQERQSNVAEGEGSDPVWNETFKFEVRYPEPESYHWIELHIMDRDPLTKDDRIGQATINVLPLIESGYEEGFSKLHPTKYNVVVEDRTYSGSIRVGMTFTKKEENDIVNYEEIGGRKHRTASE